MTGDSPREVVAEYPHDCQIVREHREGEEDRYHYEGPMGQVLSFYSPSKARLYADVQTVTGGFREEKTGERGVPPAVARSREDVLVAYLAAMPTMGRPWVRRAFDLSEDELDQRIELVRSRAEEVRTDE